MHSPHDAVGCCRDGARILGKEGEKRASQEEGPPWGTRQKAPYVGTLRGRSGMSGPIIWIHVFLMSLKQECFLPGNGLTSWPLGQGEWRLVKDLFIHRPWEALRNFLWVHLISCLYRLKDS